MTRSGRRIRVNLAAAGILLGAGVIACSTTNIGDVPAPGLASIYEGIAEEYAKLHRDDGQRGEFIGTTPWRLEFGSDGVPLGLPAPIGILADSDKPSLSRLPVIDKLFGVGETRQFRWDITKPRNGMTVGIRTDATFALSDAAFMSGSFRADYSFSGKQYVFDDPNDFDDTSAAIEEYTIAGTLFNEGYLDDDLTLQFNQILWQRVKLEFLTPQFEIDVEYTANAPLRAE